MTGPAVPPVDLAPGRRGGGRRRAQPAQPVGRVGPAGRRRPARYLVLGALLGLTWAAGLRGWMMQLAGPDSAFSWSGTFGALLVPAAVVGALLGWAEHLRRGGVRRRWQWLVLAPLVLPVVVLARPGALTLLTTTGQGGGAVGTVLLAMAGGTAVGSPGRLWWRLPLGVLGFALVPAAYLGPPMRPALDVGTAYGAWAATLFAALFVTMALACSIPLRAQRPADEGG